MKKGIVPLWISLFFSFLAVLLIVIFFFVFFRGSRVPQELAIEDSANLLAHNLLVNYLNTPVLVNNELVTFADLIRLSYTEWQRHGQDVMDAWYDAWEEDVNTYPKKIPGSSTVLVYHPVLMEESNKFLDRSKSVVDINGKIETRYFWISIHEKPFDFAEGFKLPLALILPASNRDLAPLGIDRDLVLDHMKNCYYLFRFRCSENAGAFVPVSPKKSVYVALWSSTRRVWERTGYEAGPSV